LLRPWCSLSPTLSVRRDDHDAPAWLTATEYADEAPARLAKVRTLGVHEYSFNGLCISNLLNTVK
jgi:hypothetical protein